MGDKMGMYKYLADLFQNAKDKTTPLQKERIIKWRKQPAIVKIDRPTRLTSARRLGYKAKQGFVLVRARIEKGRRKRRSLPKGRKPKRYGVYFTTARNLQAILEQRVSKRYRNLEVLNSYKAGDDSKHVWYEIILLDPNHPAIQSDKDVRWISETTSRGRSERGLTSAGKKSRSSRRKKVKK